MASDIRDRPAARDVPHAQGDRAARDGGPVDGERPPAPVSAPTPVPPPAPAPSSAAFPRRIRAARGGGLRFWLLLAALLASGVVYGVYWAGWVRGTVSTDDAHVDAPMISVSSRLRGRIAEVRVGEGDRVTPGQVLAALDHEQPATQVAQMTAALHTAEGRLRELLGAPRPEQVAVAEAEVQVREVRLRRMQNELLRARRLARANAISGQELQDAEANRAEADAELTVSRRRLALLVAGSMPEAIQQAQADVELARARLRAAQTDLDDTRLLANVQGIVARRMVDPGEHVDAGQALFQIVDGTRSWVVANLEEDQIAGVREGMPADVWVDAYPGKVFRGRVGPMYNATLSMFSLLPASSAGGSYVKVTQRVPVRIDWAAGALPPMLPGLNVAVRIYLQRAP